MNRVNTKFSVCFKTPVDGLGREWRGSGFESRTRQNGGEMKYGKVLTCEDLEEAKKLIGKKVIYGDVLYNLIMLPGDRATALLKGISQHSICPFTISSGNFQFIREVIEEEPQIMTNRQLAEWTGKRIGEYTYFDSHIAYTSYGYSKSKQNDPVPYNLRIRPWDSDEWIVPTVDIYERDCK